MSGKDNVFKKIVWAVADFVDNPETEKKTAKMIQLLAKSSSAKVVPVCVVDTTNLKPKQPPIAGLVQKRLARFKALSLKPVVTLENSPNVSFSISEKADELLNYAQKEKADLIVVNTSARKGLSRFLMGSFAETVILHSRIPLLTVNPKLEVPTKLKTIVFPSDLSLGSDTVFPKVACLALNLNAELHVFHKLSNPSSLYVGPYGVITNDLRSLDDDSHDKAQADLENLVATAKKLGVKKIKLHIDSSQKAQTDAILKYSKKVGANMVAMAARSGAIESTVLGSTTRQVVRQASCPVWVLHS